MEIPETFFGNSAITFKKAFGLSSLTQNITWMSSVKSNLKERFEIELQETRETSLIAELIVARTGLFSLQENVIPLNKILNLYL